MELSDSGSVPLSITSSYIEFNGPATVIQGDDNLIDGQVYIGNAIGTGIEVNASPSLAAFTKGPRSSIAN